MLGVKLYETKYMFLCDCSHVALSDQQKALPLLVPINAAKAKLSMRGAVRHRTMHATDHGPYQSRCNPTSAARVRANDVNMSATALLFLEEASVRRCWLLVPSPQPSACCSSPPCLRTSMPRADSPVSVTRLKDPCARLPTRPP